MQRTLAIGDVHGGLRALKQVMERAQVNKKDRLIFMGDYVDGWSQSAQVIEFIMLLKQPCVFLKGNHDIWCEHWLQTGFADKTWLAHGGREAAESYKKLSAEEKEQQLGFFAEMQLYYIDEKNRLFVHGGFTSPGGPEEEDDPLIFTVDRSLWKNAFAIQEEKSNSGLPAPYNLFHEIFIGHTPTLYFDSLKPMKALNVWNTDTGAAFTGKLTIIDVNSKKYWQSDPLPSLYPGETGRNR